ncbi:thiopurine S-methyltransferase [Luteimonas sp. RD2P54]|uniref:Thiopurine S-methyltransferase n=1 Tax=Luteimonas endophytica TaxID=3042023 RepID=A0ABT6J8G0_9GAMM|nr:thiopurine S-methyltransferase [Luteimonas endophytica]MDH5823112.1 thiopurine S-methyltransferase [Luteimonas endophytica]
MHHDFWHQRWQEGRIGFHQARVTPLLERHWDATGAPAGSQVFVPLAGKTLDMAWLAARGHRVLGVELSGLAIDQFFEEHGLVPERRKSRFGTHYSAGSIELLCGDVFGLDAAALAGCGAVFDRAALIALPAELRGRYLGELYALLPAGCRGLMITLEYPPDEMEGPPFPVVETEVRAGLEREWRVQVLERREISEAERESRFAEEGVTALSTVAYALQRRQASGS